MTKIYLNNRKIVQDKLNNTKGDDDSVADVQIADDPLKDFFKAI